MSPAIACPVLSCSQAAGFERRLFEGDKASEWTAMCRAGKAIADAVLDDFQEIGRWPEAATVLVLAGKGHNGGDALIAATEIARRHPRARVAVAFVLGKRPLRPLARRAWAELMNVGRERVVSGPADRLISSHAAFDLCLDGVFGFQFRPPLPPAARAALRRANAAAVRLRAAVDLPSGLDEPDGFRADFTYATGAVKAPVLTARNAGRVRYLDLDFFAPQRDVPSADRVLTARILDPLAGMRVARSDKRSYGHVMIVGGSRGLPGAVLMNTLAALHSGVGLVTAFVPESLAAAFAARAPEAMWVGLPETSGGGLALEGLHVLREKWSRANAFAVGSGLGQDLETRALVEEIVARAPRHLPVLLDGDALQAEVVLAAKAPLLLTPHAGEFERISGGKDLRSFCAATQATVILKGPITRICYGGEPGRRRSARPGSLPVYHSLFGGPVLARGGSGDILAGLTAGQLALAEAERKSAHGRPPAHLLPSRLQAAARGAVWHGLAADALARAKGQTAVTVTGLIDFLPGVLREL